MLKLRLLLGGVLLLVLPFWMDIAMAGAATGEEPKAAEGFRTALFASEKEGVRSPTHARFDANGRLWVVDATTDQKPDRPDAEIHSQLLILEDTDKDGRADKQTVFASESSSIQALETTVRGCLILTQGTLLELVDSNEDGIAEGRRILWQDSEPHSIAGSIQWIRWGTGGNLWMAGERSRPGPDAKSNSVRAPGIPAIWRFNRARSGLLALDASAIAFDRPAAFAMHEWHDMQVITGQHDHQILASTPLLLFPTNHFRHGRFAASGLAGTRPFRGEFIQNTHFPDPWQGRLLIASPEDSAVSGFEIEETGSGFDLIERTPLVKSTNSNFHPIDVQKGPDGAIYVLDAGPSTTPEAPAKRGRIWRISADNRPHSFGRKLTGLTTPELLAELASRDGFAREHAARVLESRPAAEVLRAYDVWKRNLPGTNSAENLRALARVAAVLHSHSSVPTELLERLFSAGDHRARILATGLMAEGAVGPDQKRRFLSTAVQDAHPGIRLRAIAGLASIDSVEAFLAALSACGKPRDEAIDLALRQLIASHKHRWLPLLEAGQLGIETRTTQLEYLVRADGSPDSVRAVRRLLFKRHPTRDQRQPLSLLLAQVGEMQDFEQLIPHLLYISQGAHNAGQHAAVLEVIVESARERIFEPTERLESALKELLRDPPRIQVPVLQLIASWNLTNLTDQITGLALRTNATTEVRVAAVQALGRLGTATAIDTIQNLSRPNNTSTPVRAAAAGSLFPFAPQVASELAAGLMNADVSGASVPLLAAGFTRREEFLPLLANALESKPATPRAAGVALQILNRSGWTSIQLAKTLRMQAGQRIERHTNSAALLQELEGLIRSSGNAARGAEIFRRTDLACAHCHSSQGDVPGIGPSLASWQGRRSLSSLMDSILEPHQTIRPDHAKVELVLKNGESIVGNRVKSLDDRVQIQEISTSRILEISSAQIVRTIQKGSAMPEGLTDSLTRSELGDLLKYLAEPVAPPLKLPPQARTKP